MAMPGDEDSQISAFSHDELLKITSSVLNELLSNDLYLSDLPRGVTFDEINNQIALLHGKSITVNILRGDDKSPVIIPQSKTRVHELKRAIKRSVNLNLERSGSKQTNVRKISWKYIWRTYNLECDGVCLEKNDEFVDSYGVKHKSTIKFVKRRRNKPVA